MTRLEWLEARRHGVGASDAPCLLGLGFKTPDEVFRSKVEPATERPVDGVRRLGQELEPALCARYAEVMGHEMAACGYEIVRNPKIEWQFCTPDFRRPDGMYVQGKTLAGFGEEWGQSGTDIIPIDYRVQVTQEMGVTGTDVIDLAALCRLSGEFRVYRVKFDDELYDWITRAGLEFWQMVQAGTPPGPDWANQFAPEVAALRTDDRPDLGEDIAALVNRYKVFAALRDEAAQEYERLRDAIKAAMGDFERATAGDWGLKLTAMKATSFTTHRKAGTQLRITKLKRRITDDHESNATIGAGQARDHIELGAAD